ncbi:cation/H(+) antiporter 4-like [Gossypium australe]|uniref:Cation/H(+) antiporter 4-like n=1 Tax=Gossypium australe TaxID=47621 RepID=A0A5B6UIQ9_9ROSI|nr:cation/H(+) antiporter 4-like [Gossypium australe]
MAYNSSSYTTGMDRTARSEEVCLKFPPKVTSPGLAALLVQKDKLGKFMDYSGPRLHFQMVVIFVFTQIIHSLLKLLGVPLFISQLLAGILMGPVIVSDEHSLVTISEDSVAVLGSLGALGFMFFMFLSGVKMDLRLTLKSGKLAIAIGLFSVLVPLIFWLMTVKTFHPGGNVFSNKIFHLAITYSGTSFPVIHSLLSELKILNSELGRLGLSAALIGDMVTLVLTMFSVWVNTGIQKGSKDVLFDVGLAMLYVCILVFVLRPGMKWMVKRTPEAGQIKDTCFYIIILAFMISPRFTELFRVYFLYGPFIFGLAVPDGPPLGSALVEKLDPVVSGMFMPIFATTCGMRFDLSYFKYTTKYAYHQAVGAVVTLIIKFGVSLLLPLLCKMPTRDSFALAFIMVSKGIVEIGSYSIMNDSRIISEDIFAHLTIVIIIVASVVPIAVKKLYDPSKKYLCFQKRTVMNSKFNQELRMIGCVHVPGNVNSIINLLNASCPTRECPIALDILHLVKLSGQATPLFIAHHKQQKASSNKSYSDNVVVAFKQFERDNLGAVSVNFFTAVSPSNLMYEDTCNLAMDRLTSFIILPFHRRWYSDGSIESEDQTLRSLNFDILERAPCSVGILVEGRRNIKGSNSKDTLSPSNSSSYAIAVIFLGGEDDREALALAKRFSQDESVSLTIIHLKAVDSLEFFLDEDERMLDKEMLKDINASVPLTYIEEHVKDGPETSTFLRSIVKDYQLIIVGRRYRSEDAITLGLEEWCEFREIGIIGDLLSSSDFVGNFSLLIVQQQPKRTG